jgi:hypothetical protein
MLDRNDEAEIRRKVEFEVGNHSQNFEWHPDQRLSVTHETLQVRALYAVIHLKVVRKGQSGPIVHETRSQLLRQWEN